MYLREWDSLHWTASAWIFENIFKASPEEIRLPTFFRQGRTRIDNLTLCFLGNASLNSTTHAYKHNKSYNNEGRCLTLELESHKLAFVFAYVPNSGQDLKRLDYRIGTWEKDMGDYLDSLRQRGLHVCYVGDLNVAHLDRDIWNVTAKHIAKSAGTTPQVRACMLAPPKAVRMPRMRSVAVAVSPQPAWDPRYKPIGTRCHDRAIRAGLRGLVPRIAPGRGSRLHGSSS